MGVQMKKSLSKVEEAVQVGSPFMLQYGPDEKSPVVVVQNFPRLGERQTCKL